MRVLFCVEFYHPSMGGAQEVVRHLAERMCRCGHNVTVATTWLEQRRELKHNGVNIKQFKISGNAAYGLRGEVAAYREFILNEKFDVILFYAAQQWTFDSIIEFLPSISAKKVFVPCGYSGLYLRSWKKYYEEMPDILRQIDACVYHADSYRDFDFARDNGIENGVLIPNAANLDEFMVPQDLGFRERHGIPESALLLLTVGSVTGLKGHRECLDAFAAADFADKDAVLIINGNFPHAGAMHSALISQIRGIYRARGFMRGSLDMTRILRRKIAGLWVKQNDPTQDLEKNINNGHFGNKRVLRTDLARSELVQAFINSNLFVFASNIEYSPLVLYEACAAGLPFISVPVGNSREITAWTGGGVICEAPVDSEGYTRVDPMVFAQTISKTLANKERMSLMSSNGRQSAEKKFNWDVISLRYQELFQNLVQSEA
ncbi:glycosyltransferase family 4 protein [Pannonibacter phragmitetus]|uniref:glycosyltransferase family 4 protein n=1 Tax=Pannonibacter phragmitetus TaxID=121719 RepID=UPI0009E22654|nr:glycosyltransferase family 4 protein [Pannonibacter phragmitetus]